MRLAPPARILAVLALAACRDPHPVRGPAGGAAAGSRSGPVIAVARIDVPALLRQDPARFGCALERALGYRDAEWNCETSAGAAVTDPCADGFAAGPELPDEVARRIHTALRAVDLSWEGGALQEVRFRFDPGTPESELPRLLRFGPGALEAAAAAGPGRCDTPCYEVLLFEADETACEEGEEEDEAAGGPAR